MAGHRLPFHEHAGAYACVVLSGSFLERGAIGEAECRAGDIIVHPSGERHADDFGGGGALCLNLQLAEREAQPAARRADISILRAADELAAEIAKGESGDRLVADSLIAELGDLSGLALKRGVTDDCVARVLEALNDGPDADWTLENLAEIAGRHPTHLARAFRSRLGVSVGVYRRRRRLTRLALDLRLSNVSLATLALQHGYADQAHMTREFRAFAGLSPARWRKLAAR
jgi:AraC family transcriptional regulator